MNRPGLCLTTAFLAILGVGTITPCHGYASERAVIEVCGESGSEVMWFRPGAVLFTDRDYRLAECPADLAGKRFLRGSIDSTRFDVVQGGRLIVLTPHAIAGASSQAEALQAQGFTRRKAAPFQLFGSREIDQVLAYEKQAAAGECYRFGKWVVVLGFEDARSARNRSRAADGKASRSSMQSKMEQPGFSTNIRIVGQNPRTAAYS